MSVFYLQLWVSNAKLLSYYMLYRCVTGCLVVLSLMTRSSGTSWEPIPFQQAVRAMLLPYLADFLNQRGNR